MKAFLRSAFLVLMVLVGLAEPHSAHAQEAPRLQISLGTGALNPGDVVTLPDTAVGDTSEPLVLTIANEGDADLELSALDPPALSGDGAAFLIDTSETETTIAPGGSTTLDLIFFPSEAGKIEATLTITTNDPELPVFPLTVAGTAVEGED